MIDKPHAPTAAAPSRRPSSSPADVVRPWSVRHSLLIVCWTPVLAQVFASTFNIAYNLQHLRPLLTADQQRLFQWTIAIYNLIVYPVAGAYWWHSVMAIRPAFDACLQQREPPRVQLARARRRCINIPWWFTGIGASAWLFCIPVFLTVLSLSRDPLRWEVHFHLTVSFLIAASMGLTHAFFASEIIIQRLLFPVLFQDAKPSDTAGGVALSLTGRGLMWAFSAVICPVVSLLLLALNPDPTHHEEPVIVLWVGGAAIVFGVFSAWLLGNWISQPVRRLRDASRRVSHGDLDFSIELLRADEFGPLIDEFNRMLRELKEKEQLQETFGLHVGRQAALQILQRDPGLGGTQQNVTIMFADLRGFTARCNNSSAEEAVRILNEFFSAMVEVIDQHRGMVNKFLGDGLMAIFGVGSPDANHAQLALDAGKEMVRRTQFLSNQLVLAENRPLQVGIGIHTGTAVVGSIGSPRRMEYTAIGDTVNTASRVESLTKQLSVPLLITAHTYRNLSDHAGLFACPPQQVKGIAEPVEVYAWNPVLQKASH
ncbi:MAG: adenylate/guanylate cyclase domain-containing protein [Pirellulaceae bacterium]|nr:adenylate/guanylate cyclase domain-containing protein [Planctomycetales bacterium]